MRRAPRIRLAAGSAALATLLASCSWGFGMPRGASEQGTDVFHLWQIFFIAAIPVAGVVYGLILWSVIRYRRRRDDDPDAQGADFHDHTAIEIVYTAIPVLIVIGLFVATLVTGARVNAVTSHPDVTLNAQAYQWGWRFTYVGQAVTIVSPPSGEFVPGPEIVMPLGKTVQVVLTSNDVIHAFWVPEFVYKHDAIPGRMFVFDITPTRTGTFYGECAEFCGLNHAYMTFSVRVVPSSEFSTWLAGQRSAEGTGA